VSGQNEGEESCADCLQRARTEGVGGRGAGHGRPCHAAAQGRACRSCHTVPRASPTQGWGKGGMLSPRARRRDYLQGARTEGEGSRARQQWPPAPRRRIGPPALATTSRATGPTRAGVGEGRDTAGLLLRRHVAHVAAAACKELARRGRAAAAAGDGRPRHSTAQGHMRRPHDTIPRGPPVREWRQGREAAELCLRRRLAHITSS